MNFKTFIIEIASLNGTPSSYNKYNIIIIYSTNAYKTQKTFLVF